MPKKPAHELTTEEAMKRLFPKPVRDTAQAEVKAANEKGKDNTK
jgi:hypothetical protein